MTTYILTYRTPCDYTPGMSDVQARWKAWFESLGTSLVDAGSPVFESRTLGESGVSNALGGYSIIAAEELSAAVAIAEGCPMLAQGGGVEIGVLAELTHRGTHQSRPGLPVTATADEARVSPHD